MRMCSSTFKEASTFNQPLDSWDVSNVRSMICMFNRASSFNQPLNSWYIHFFKDELGNMFDEATSFDKNNALWYDSDSDSD